MAEINELYLSYISRGDAMSIEKMKSMTKGKLIAYNNNLPSSYKRKTKEQSKLYKDFIIALNKVYPANAERHLRKIEDSTFNHICCENNKADIALFKDNFDSVLTEIDDKNREQYNQYMTCKVMCECGAEICRANASRHKSSIKHRDFIIIKNK